MHVRSSLEEFYFLSVVALFERMKRSIWSRQDLRTSSDKGEPRRAWERDMPPIIKEIKASASLLLLGTPDSFKCSDITSWNLCISSARTSFTVSPERGISPRLAGRGHPDSGLSLCSGERYARAMERTHRDPRLPAANDSRRRNELLSDERRASARRVCRLGKWA